MFGRSWALFKQTMGVLRQDRELLLFPIVAASLSIIATAVVGGLGVLGALSIPAVTQAFQSPASGQSDSTSLIPIAYGIVVLFILYLVVALITTYYGGGLVGAALIRLRGGDPTFGDGIRIANRHLRGILGYALIQATVGLVQSLLSRGQGGQRNVAGQVVAGVVGAAWSVITFLVIPFLVDKDLGPLAAIKESTASLKRTFGEQLVGRAGIGVVFGLPIVLIIALVVVLGVVFVSNDQMGALVATVVVAALLAIALAIVSSAANAVFRAAVYLYVQEGTVGATFDAATMRAAFQPA
jgi:hypothetical protein